MIKLRLGALLCLLALAPVGCGQIPQQTEDEGQPSAELEQPAEEADGEDAAADSAPEEGEGEAQGQTRMASTGPETIVSTDMLSEDEAARAETLALESSVLGELTSMAVDRDALAEEEGLSAASDLAERPSYRVLYTQRHNDKYATSRKAEVAVYRYDTGEVTLSTVDLESGEVEALEVPESFPVPLLPAETAEAAAIARADAGVRARLEEAGLDPDEAQANGIITVAREEGARCAEARCVRLFFSDFEMPMPSFSVVVDMSRMELVEIEEMPGMGEGEGQ